VRPKGSAFQAGVTPRKIVVHQVEGDLADVYIGKSEERPYELHGDQLVLRPRWKSEGKSWKGVRIFEHVC
jgi:hypothetical protein